jgi:hypothetical protein
MSRRPRDAQLAALEAVLPPEYRDLAEYLAGVFLPELIAKVIAIGLPPDLAAVVACEAVDAVARKIINGAQICAATARAGDARKPPH